MAAPLAFSYAVLFVLVLVAAGIFVDTGFLRSNLQHPVGPGPYKGREALALRRVRIAARRLMKRPRKVEGS